MAVDPMPEVLHRMPAAYPGAECDGELGESLVPVARQTTWQEDLSSRVNGQQAFLVHNVLTPAEANSFIEVSERCGYSSVAPDICTPPGMRMNLASHWMAPRDWMQTLFERCRLALPQEIERKRLLGFSCRVDMYKYLENMHFKRHTDGEWPAYEVDDKNRDRIVTLDTSIHGQSKLSMLLYLNDASEATEYDGVQGGSTKLYETQEGGRAFEVVPRKGAALFFRHGFGSGSVLHEGCPVKGQRPKYVARINVMYEADDDDDDDDQ